MKMPQLVHEIGPKLRAASFEKLSARRQLCRWQRVSHTPTPHNGHQGDKFYCLLRQTIDHPLLVKRIGATDQWEAGYGQAFLWDEPVIGWLC